MNRPEPEVLSDSKEKMSISGKQEYSRIDFAKRCGLPENRALAELWSIKFASWLEELKLPEALISDLEFVYLPVCNYLLNSKHISPERTAIIGINGSQGSGKTTFSYLLAQVIREICGLKVVCCSIDDFYLTRSEREKLSREVHPLLITRGVPGTHDVLLGLQTFESLIHATNETITPIPVFDKSIDDRKSKEEWIQFLGRPNLILFEGWCVAAKAVDEKELEIPINDLERNHDEDRTFRKFANEALKDQYAKWFEMIGLLIMLQVPGFEQVMEWRWVQEKKLAEKYSGALIRNRIMTEAENHFFIGHFERITRQMLLGMPRTADVVFKINESHSIERIKIN
jgi:D-glycerate 3-kinase